MIRESIFIISEVRLYLLILDLAGKNEKIIEVLNGALGGLCLYYRRGCLRTATPQEWNYSVNVAMQCHRVNFSTDFKKEFCTCMKIPFKIDLLMNFCKSMLLSFHTKNIKLEDEHAQNRVIFCCCNTEPIGF